MTSLMILKRTKITDSMSIFIKVCLIKHWVSFTLARFSVFNGNFMVSKFMDNITVNLVLNGAIFLATCVGTPLVARLILGRLECVICHLSYLPTVCLGWKGLCKVEFIIFLQRLLLFYSVTSWTL